MEPERAELIRLSKGATLVAPSPVHREIGNALSAMFKRRAIELDDALGVLDAYDAYVIVRAINQRAPILSLDNVLKDRARSLKVEILEVKAT
jgi:hypothetical protein